MFFKFGGSPSAAKSKKKRACAPDGNKTVKNVASARSGSTFYQFLGEIREPRGCHHWPFFHVFSTLAPFWTQSAPRDAPQTVLGPHFHLFGMIPINFFIDFRRFLRGHGPYFCTLFSRFVVCFFGALWCVVCAVCGV